MDTYVITLLLYMSGFFHSPKMIVYYDSTYKLSWFKRINMKTEFRKFEPTSTRAAEILNKSCFNYNMYIVSSDLHYDIHGIKNYRIKGLSYLNQRASVVTIKNSNDKDVEKIILHEYAHAAAGIEHCEYKNCLMNSAKGKYSNLKYCNDFQGNCKIVMKKYLKL